MSDTQWGGAAALAIAQDALVLLQTHRVSANPQNFEVAFVYLAGANEALRTEIDARIAQGAALNDESFLQLHATHIGAPKTTANAAIAGELDKIVEALSVAGSDAQDYAETLKQAAQAFEATRDPTSLGALVKGLTQSALTIAARNEQLSQSMALSSQKIETLQANLRDVKAEAVTDGLTGLANRRAFDAALQQEVARGATELCLLMCDIDHFKRFNDRCGHVVGDQVIRFIASILKEHATGEYVAARYGGEEFALIMPRTNIHRAQSIAAAIRAAVRAKKLTKRSTGETFGTITASFGIARRTIGDTPASLLKRADACLYASKQNGRDRITLDSELHTPAL